jgi:pimeloyl-ACP methyl ester carboxylesterase
VGDAVHLDGHGSTLLGRWDGLTSFGVWVKDTRMRRILSALLLLLLALVSLPPLVYALFPEPLPELPPPGRRIPVAEGVAVNTIERGSGPAVVLVHGLPGCGYDWTRLADALAARGLHALAYDRVGYGRSDARPDDDFTVDANARELRALLAREDLRDVTVVGWSYGGATAIRAAIQDPSRIGRLVLVGSAGPGYEESEPPALFAVLFSAPVMAWMAAVPPVSRGLQTTMSRQAFSGQPEPDWWLPQLRANFAAPGTRRTFREEQAQFSLDGLDPSPIERPILVIHGDRDQLVPLAVGESLHDHARGSQLSVVKGGSHMLPITHAELLAERIAAFVEGG